MHNRLIGSWKSWVGFGLIVAALLVGVTGGMAWADDPNGTDESALDFGSGTEYVGPSLWAVLRKQAAGESVDSPLTVWLGYADSEKAAVDAAIKAVGGVEGVGRPHSWTIPTEHILSIIQMPEISYAALDLGDLVGGAPSVRMNKILRDIVSAHAGGVPASRAVLYGMFAHEDSIAVWVVIPDATTETRVRAWLKAQGLYAPPMASHAEVGYDVAVLLGPADIMALHNAFENIRLEAESYEGNKLGVDRSTWPESTVEYEKAIVAPLLEPEPDDGSGSAATGGSTSSITNPGGSGVPSVPAWESDLEDRRVGHGVKKWHNAGFKGEGIKVGIIDWGFWGIDTVPGFGALDIADGPDDTASDSNALCQSVTQGMLPNSRWLGPADIFVGECQPRFAAFVLDHGTDVASLVKDFAPEAEFLFAQASSPRQLWIAANWLNAKGADVIVHAGGYPYDGRGDGTTEFGETSFIADPPIVNDRHAPYRYYPGALATVDKVVQSDSGPVWVNAAGNFENLTMYLTSPKLLGGSGSYKDFLVLDSNGSDDENKTCQIVPKEGDVWGPQIYVYGLRWADTWPTGAKSLDFFISDRGDNPLKLWSPTFVRSYRAKQYPGNYPLRRVLKLSSNDNDTECLRIRINADDDGVVAPPEWVQFQVMSLNYDNDVLGASDDGDGHSIVNPGSSFNEGFLAVGAQDFHSDSADPELMEYSSYGPVYESGADGVTTLPDRVKPDIVAGSGAATYRKWKSKCEDDYTTAAECGDALYFGGTSAATGHVGGLAALVVQWFNKLGISYGPDDIANYLRSAAIQQDDDEDPSEEWGHGLVKLPCTSTFLVTLPYSGSHSWSSSDCESTRRDGRSVDYYAFALDSAKQVQIDVLSEVDSYLYLIEGAFSGGTDYLEYDDDDGADSNDARITRLLDAGVYTIAVTTYNSGSAGLYDLRVTSTSAFTNK